MIKYSLIIALIFYGGDLLALPSGTIMAIPTRGVTYGSELITIFYEIENQTDDEFIVYNIETSCNCTSSDVKLPMLLKPRQNMKTPILFRPQGKFGSQKGSVVFYTNDYREPRKEREFQLEIADPIQLSSNHISFNGVSRTENVQSEIELKYLIERSPESKISLRSPAPWISAQIASLAADLSTVRLVVTINAAKLPIDKLKGQTELLIATGMTELPEIPIFVTWALKQSHRIEPSILSAKCRVGALPKIYFSVQADEPFALTKLASNSPDFEISKIHPKNGTDRKHFLVVKYNNNVVTGKRSDTFRLFTDSVNMPVIVGRFFFSVF